MGNITYAAIILLGSLAHATGCISRTSFENALRVVLPARKHNMIPEELQAFDIGWNHECTLAALQPA